MQIKVCILNGLTRKIIHENYPSKLCIVLTRKKSVSNFCVGMNIKVFQIVSEKNTFLLFTCTKNCFKVNTFLHT